MASHASIVFLVLAVQAQLGVAQLTPNSTMQHFSSRGESGPTPRERAGEGTENASPSKSAWFKSLCLLGCLLIVGKFLRLVTPTFQRFFLPASIIAGLLFFGFLQVLLVSSPSTHHLFVNEFTVGWNKIGYFGLNFVFSSLFLGSNIPSFNTIVTKAAPQLVYNQIINWTLWSTSVLVVGLICVPFLGASPMLATLIPVGFTGGHPIAFALVDKFEKVGYEDGLGLGLLISTIGQLFSLLLGVVWIQMAQRRGLLEVRPVDSESDTVEVAFVAKGLFNPDNAPSAGKQTVCADSIDVLTLHLGVAMIAMLSGQAIGEFTGKFIPEFVWMMSMGIVLQLLHQSLVGRGCIPPLLDANIMARLHGLFLDFLVVSAMSVVNVSRILPQIPAVCLLSAICLIVLGLMTWYVAPVVLPDYWFERAICEYGQCTGVISSGLVLLKMCDPNQSLPVLDSFALKNFLAMPMLFTFLPFTFDIIERWTLWVLLGICLGLLFIFWALWFFYVRHIHQQGGGCESAAVAAKHC